MPDLERPDLLGQAALLSDRTRCRLLLALEAQELTVTELCSVLQLPQSTTSRHLKVLGDNGWIGSRRDGTRRFYESSLDRRTPSQRRLWLLLRESLVSSNSADQDSQRLEQVLARRRRRSEEFFDASADAWEATRTELFGDRFDLYGLLALTDPQWKVGDLGCGTGRMTAALAPFVREVVAVDSSRPMLAAARRRLEGTTNVEVRRGNLEHLPVDDQDLDAAVLVLALHHTADPRKVLGEALRVLKPGGRLVVVDMQAHDREKYQAEMGHVWLGFSDEHLGSLFSACGLEDFEYRAVPADLSSRGPALFVARARRAARHSVGRSEQQTTTMSLGGREE
jgi:ArsR family transcriptional regulator